MQGRWAGTPHTHTAPPSCLERTSPSFPWPTPCLRPPKPATAPTEPCTSHSAAAHSIRMASACSLGGAHCKVVFWALVCTVLFVGTSQQNITVATTVVPEGKTEVATASLTSIKTTSDDVQVPTSASHVALPVTTTAVAATSNQSITAEPATVKNADQTLSTEPKVETPDATVAGDHDNATTQQMERNITDRALRYEAHPGDEDMTTTTQIIPPVVSEPATTALPDTSSGPTMTKEVKVVVNCLPKVQDNVEIPGCLRFKEPITCEDFKKTNMDVADILCNSHRHRSPSGSCHVNLAPTDTDPRCLLLNPNVVGQIEELSESTKAALKQRGVEFTSSQPSKPRTTLIALVTTGLVVAALILCGYFLSNRQSWSPGSRRLDEDYAGNDSPDNTLISVATRDQSGQGDKANLKGGTQENGTGQAVTPTATNGHSNKPHVVADTEL